MIETRYALCASRIIRDSSENRMTAVDIFEDIGSPAFPVVIPRASFLWVLTRAEADAPVHNGTIAIRQGEVELGRFPINVDFQEGLFTRNIVVVGGLVIPQAGRINVIFEIPNIVTTTYHIDVRAVQQVIAQQAVPGAPVPPEGAGTLVI